MPPRKPKITSLDPQAHYVLKLASCPNPDFGEIRRPKPPMVAEGNLETIFRDAGTYRLGLGGGNWLRADLFLGGRQIAHMGYNGRIWPGKEWQSGMKPLCEPPEWFGRPANPNEWF
jgi:hypothetical protein